MAISKIKTVSIEDDAITTGKILNDAVTGAKIPAGAVVAEIADDSIAGGKFTNDIAISTTGAITTTGAFTSKGIDDNGTETGIIITSDESVGIGKSVTPNNFSGFQCVTVGGSDATTGSLLDLEDSSGNIDGRVSGEEGNLLLGADPASATASSKITLQINSNEKMKIETNGNATIMDGNLVIGTSGHGIDFTATADGAGTDSSELLDDYEEGTWTATATAYGGTFTASDEQYVKVGRMVHFDCVLSFNGTDTDRVDIGGLPYTATNTAAVATYFAGGGSYNNFKAVVSGAGIVGGNINGDASYTSVSGMTARFSGTYMATV